MRKLPHTTVQKVRKLRDAGWAQKEIAKTLGISPSSVNKVIAMAKVEAVPLPEVEEPAGEDVPTEVPEGVDLKTVDRWIGRVERAAETAAAAKDFAAFSSLMSRLTGLIEHKRKATPLPKVDPNEQPDMVAAAKSARDKLHKLADSLVRVSQTELADTIGRILRESPH